MLRYVGNMVGSITISNVLILLSSSVLQNLQNLSKSTCGEHLGSDPDDLVGHHSAHSCQQISSRAKNSQRPYIQKAKKFAESAPQSKTFCGKSA